MIPGPAKLNRVISETGPKVSLLLSRNLGRVKRVPTQPIHHNTAEHIPKMSGEDEIHSPSEAAAGPPPPPPPPPPPAPAQQPPPKQEQRQSTTPSSLDACEVIPKPESSPSNPTPSGQKRRRFPVSCFECRRRKLKCDREQPCQRCRGSRRECIYANESPAAKVPKISEHQNAPRLYREFLESTGRYERPPNNAYAITETKVPTTPPIQQHAFDRQDRYEPMTKNFGQITSNERVEPPVQQVQQYPQQLPQIQYVSQGAHDYLKNSPSHVTSIEQHQVPISRLLSAPGDNGPRSMLDKSSNKQNNYTSQQRPPGYVHNFKGKPFTRGKNARVRYFGRSHVSSLLTQFDGLKPFVQEALPFNPAVPQLRREFQVWKERMKDKEEHEDIECNPNLLENIPNNSNEVENLVKAYMNNFESTHRIIHIPSFWKEYSDFWRNDKEKAAPEFVAQLLLMMACGLLFNSQPPSALPPSINRDAVVRRQTAVRWVHSVERWLCHRQRGDLTLIRIHCLLILAKRVNSIDEFDLWTQVGTLVRLAMTMGLHRDPSQLQKISVFHAECRRRLWATILELDLQASMERGMPMNISPNDHDCKPPLCINDWDVLESTPEAPPSRPGSFTETSFQCALLASLPTRIEIAKVINTISSDPPYEEILRLDKELTTHLVSLPGHLKIESTNKAHLEAGLSLPKQMLDLHLRRFLLLLHIPFSIAAEAIDGGDPRYSYSRHVCLENASVLLSHYKAFPDTSDLRCLLFAAEHAQAALTICHELFIGRPTAGLGFAKELYALYKDNYLALVDATLGLFEKRISMLGKGLKDYFFWLWWGCL
ncbi:Similar to Activator of stress genes 1; acc. no. P40467 [Pyronema omphalodes CBS 100304]|uniref:Similar to Activator of stress genes 1 acc. no. P40467 n=1 Tax=Pyronema omphalodes (strain CBS 100304) TaxID=1076935 RepID=U4KTU9_PYROM|nr:Similar to Activator of stress genes 1; acc. no. P40467 [Pyronema omphalodes CBS 100304]